MNFVVFGLIKCFKNKKEPNKHKTFVYEKKYETMEKDKFFISSERCKIPLLLKL